MSAQAARRYTPDIRAVENVLLSSQPFFVHAREQLRCPSFTIHDCICRRSCRLVDKENVSNATVAPHPSARCVSPCACCARTSCRYQPALYGCRALLLPRRVRPHRLLHALNQGAFKRGTLQMRIWARDLRSPAREPQGPMEHILFYPLSWGDGINITVCWAEQGDSEEGHRDV